MWQGRQKISSNKIMLVILVLIFWSVNGFVYATTPDEVEDLFEAADKVIIEAFTMVLEAEKAGADTSDLLTKLNTTVQSLSEDKYQLTFEVNQQLLEDVEAKIVEIKEILEEATILKESALIERENAFRSKTVLNLVEVALFIGILFRLWVYTKSYYYRKIERIELEAS